ncbi:MAG: argininosuccinate lyase, partial [Deltaproteobacteria bacterium]|nr:argininosuccinate lyase [Deltaproteobacteria bacterium]
LWSSSEFDFIHLPESFCTGSSMMPQKMNPDVPELVRGKTGRVYGHLIALLTTMKSLPLAYNKDMQEDKEPLFDLFETVINATDILRALMEGTKPNEAKMKAAASDGFLLATDLADWLVKQGLDFRSSHEVTAQVVRFALEKKRDFLDLTLEELKTFSPLFSNDLFKALDLQTAINARRAIGGTSKENVLKEIQRLKKHLM